MIPGNPHPLLMAGGGGDPLDDLGVIARSVRMRAAATASFTRVFGAPTNAKKWTFSTWVKRAKLAAYQGLFDAYANGSNFTSLMFDTADKYWLVNTISGGTASQALSNALYRDIASHLHLQITFDSDNGTAADRCILWVNGERIAVTGSTPLGQTSYLNASGYTHSFGRRIDGNYNFDGVMSQGIFVDGQALTPAAFAQTNPITGQWRPKSKAAIRAAVAVAGGPRNGWGANGAFLPFDDTTSLTTLGYDRSQSDTDTTGNNWTANNILLPDDSRVDTPTANYPVFNSLQPFVASSSLADGNLVFNCSLTGSEAHSVLTIPVPQIGVWDTEIQISSASTTLNATGCEIGIVGGLPSATNNNCRLSQYASSTVYRADGQKGVDGVFSAYGASWGAGDKITLKIDRGSNQITFFKNGVSQGAITLDTQDIFVGICLRVTSGSSAALLTAETSKMGFPVAGALPICTKNITQPTNSAVVKPTSAFVGVTDTGANVQTTLANARAGWVNYIEIFKRRDASEGWRWRFSDDLANYLDSSSTAAKAAFPALSGTSYVGYAIKVAAANGVASGRLTHVNGVADTVTDGLGNTRKMVILKNESTGVWYVYHPDLTAGKLLYLEQTGIETTDATLSNVLSNSFQVAAALASGTYRWIAFAEIDGFVKLGKHVGNGVADGPFDNMGLLPALYWTKDKDRNTANWSVTSIAMNAYNPATLNLRFNTTAGDSSNTPTIDMNSNGSKLRSGGTDDANYSNETNIFIAFAAYPFRYANAR